MGGFYVKVLDVASLQGGIEKTIADIETKRTQIEAIQRAVRNLHSLENALTGQAGDSIRAFYKDTHEPFLIFLHQSLTDYEQALERISEAVNSVESDSNGYISQAFLEGEVTEAFDKVGRGAKEFADDANQIINRVSDLVSTPEIDESEVMDNVRQGKEKATDLVEELVELDDFGTTQLENTQDNLQTMKGFLSEMESGFVDGDSSIANYNVESTRGMSAYKTIVDDVYNKGDVGTEELAAKEYVPKVEGEEIKSGEHSSLHDVDPERMDSNQAVKLVIAKGKEQLPLTIAAAAKTDKWWNKGLKTVGKGIKTTANFLFIDDARTIISKDATFVERGMSTVSLTPWGKITKLAKGKKLFSTPKKKPIHNLTKKQLATKPKHSPTPDKWVQNGGKVKVNDKGTWTYTNKKGQSVSYPNGFPDFSKYVHPKVKPVTIKVNKPKNHQKDYRRANKEAGLGKNTDPPITSSTKPPEGYTWHHHQDGKTMVLVEREVHTEFTHQGGASMVQKK